jgi:hypothetical protein
MEKNRKIYIYNRNNGTTCERYVTDVIDGHLYKFNLDINGGSGVYYYDSYSGVVSTLDFTFNTEDASVLVSLDKNSIELIRKSDIHMDWVH